MRTLRQTSPTESNMATPKQGRKILPVFRFSRTLAMVAKTAIGKPYKIDLVNNRFEIYSSSPSRFGAEGCMAFSTCLWYFNQRYNSQPGPVCGSFIEKN